MTMKTKLLKQMGSAATAFGVLAAVNFGASVPASADVNIGALACQPPFLDQAERLRWHEFYLINPLGSLDTWVVCPIAFDTIKLPNSFNIGAFGNATVPGTNALCYANIVDLRNQHIPTFNFLDNPGQQMTFQRIMSTKNPANTLWSSWLSTTVDQVVNSATMMDPPPTPIDPTGTEGPAYWTITVNCLLKPGQAINMVSLWPTLN
jgi:hypothetical protein